MLSFCFSEWSCRSVCEFMCQYLYLRQVFTVWRKSFGHSSEIFLCLLTSHIWILSSVLSFFLLRKSCDFVRIFVSITVHVSVQSFSSRTVFGFMNHAFVKWFDLYTCVHDFWQFFNRLFSRDPLKEFISHLCEFICQYLYEMSHVFSSLTIICLCFSCLK